MEWGRAKTILILAFLMLNLMLGYQLWQSKFKLPDESSEIELIAEEVMSIAASKNIMLDAVIPNETPRMNEITVTFGEEGIMGKKVEFDQAIPYNIAITGSEAWTVLAEHIPNLDEYRYDPYTSHSGIVVLHQLANGYPMFDVRLELKAELQQIVSYKQNYVEILESGDLASEQRVLSAYLAIGRLVENYMRPGSVITDVQLGYHGQIFNSETQVLAPTWRIMTSDNEMYYVHAINGSVELPTKGIE
jgi:regulatory protein YycI of two-component signal transduction system YycFG